MKEITLEQSKQLQLSMLRALHRCCEEHGIIYHLAYGTLLGAVRHRGFIPWDDDIDVLMPREDYNRFFAVFNDWCQEEIKAISIELDDKYYLPAGKLIRTDTTLVEFVDCDKPIGVYLDVFPVDNLPSQEDKARAFYKRMEPLKFVLTEKNRCLKGLPLNAKNLIHYAFKLIFLPFSRKFVIKKLSALSQKHNGIDTALVCATVSAVSFNEVLPKKLLSEKILADFEGEKFYIPKEYDEILKHFYGDYMKLPPEDKQISHHGYTARFNE